MIDKYKSLLLIILIFGGINFFTFRDPFTITLLTNQFGLFFYYLILFITASTVPALLIFGLRKKKLLIVAVVLILVVMLLGGINKMYYTNSSNISFSTTQNQDQKKSLDTRIKEQHEFQSLNFCFTVQLPDVPDQNGPSSQLVFSEAFASVDKCENQLLSLRYNPMNLRIIEIPRNYDFNFRKEYEELKNIQTKAITGEKIMVNGLTVYRKPITIHDEYFLSAENDDYKNDVILYYFEKGNALIFLYYEPNEYYSENDVLQVISSLKSLN